MTAMVESEQLAGPDQGSGKPRLDMAGLRDVLAASLRAGQLMLEAGAATRRVEEVVHRLGTALGADWMDVYVTPTGIIAMATSHGEHRTRVMRVVKLGVDLARVDALYALSRRASEEGLSLEQVETILDQIAARPRLYSLQVTSLAVGVACGAFAILFGGGPREFLATTVAAGLAQSLRAWLLTRRLSPVVATVYDATVAALLGLGMAALLGAQTDTVLLASVLLLVPGVFLVGSISDLIWGNLLSGLARGAYAFLLTAGIGAGLWLVILLLGRNLL